MTDYSLADLPQPEYEGPLPVNEISVDGENPNSMSADLFNMLCDRIEQRGWIGNNIIVDGNNIIADGEHRWRAAKQVGLDEVPVKRYQMSDAERRVIRQELNKLSGEHDPDADVQEYLQIAQSDKYHELDELITHTEPETDLQKLVDDFRPNKTDFDDMISDSSIQDRDPVRTKKFTLTTSQINTVEMAISEAKAMGEFERTGNPNIDGNALHRVCRQFLRNS